MHLRVRLVAALTGVLLFAIFVATSALPVSAHEDRGVGDFDVVVGFGDEPAYSGQPNSVEVHVTQDGKPVADIGSDLSAEVIQGDATRVFRLEPNFVPGAYGEVGDYRAWFIPTRPGRYTFRIFGTIDSPEGAVKIDESFTSSPKGFDEVQNPATASFPVGDPTSGELTQRVEQESARTAEAASAASSARTVAMAGAVLGALALVIAIVAVAMGRRRKTA